MSEEVHYGRYRSDDGDVTDDDATEVWEVFELDLCCCQLRTAETNYLLEMFSYNLMGALATIPEGSRCRATIRLHISGSDGDCEIRGATIEYPRQLTEKELARLAADKARVLKQRVAARERAAATEERQERAQLARLLQKYGQPGQPEKDAPG